MSTSAAPLDDRAAAAAISFELEAGAAGGARVRGAFLFATARRAREEGIRALREYNASTLDCSGISASDSAGLTVLLDWLALARREGRTLRYLNLPDGLLALARISEVDEFLQQGV